MIGRGIYLGVNALIVAFLLAPVAIVAVFAVNPTPFIQFPPVGVSPRWFQKFRKTCWATSSASIRSRR